MNGYILICLEMVIMVSIHILLTSECTAGWGVIHLSLCH